MILKVPSNPVILLLYVNTSIQIEKANTNIKVSCLDILFVLLVAFSRVFVLCQQLYV